MIDFKYAETLFNHLYGQIHGYDVSNAARAKFGGDTSKLLYGELPFQTWKEIVEHVKPKSDGVFIDLGSGTGRVTMESHIAFDFKKCIGIELLQGLHAKALEVKDKFDKEVAPQISSALEGRELTYINKSFFDVNLSEADLILMNHPFKDGDVFLELEEKFLRELKSGTKIVTIIRALHNPAFKSLGKKSFKFSWGDSTAHFFEV